MGLTPVPDDHVAAIVTSLEMVTRPLPKHVSAAPLKLVRWPKPDAAKYRALFARVGIPWLWFSRAILDDTALLTIIADPDVEVYAVTDPKGIEVGILELDFREAGQAEIAFFGLVPELAGKGFGRWLMAETLARAWRKDVNRVWVHTCTLDAPGALGFYRAQGFVPYQRQIETFADPRLTGAIPIDAAPQIPLLTRR
jgi:GNAT superfamily N-acetyltransferase